MIGPVGSLDMRPLATGRVLAVLGASRAGSAKCRGAKCQVARSGGSARLRPVRCEAGGHVPPMTEAPSERETSGRRSARRVLDEPAAGDDGTGVTTIPADREPLDASSRRQVTVLFSDLVGSTAIFQQLDPETVRDILLAYQGRCAEVVGRFGGHIGRFMGDGILIYFGYPIAHEDDARRTVLVGLQLVEAVQALSRETSRDHGVSLAVRVGIHTGVVIAGEMGSGEWRERHDVVGATPNVAYRVQSAANPDTVVISPATYDLVGGYFVVEDLGPQHLRGLAQPVPLYRVVAASGAESRLEAEPSWSPLIGRQQELAALSAHWERARSGPPTAVVVEGEPGIGKSRLVEALKDHAESGGGRCLTLQCSPYHANTVLHPVVRHLERTVGKDDGDEEVALLASLASLAMPPGHADPRSTPEQRRERLFEAILAWLDRLALEAPLLLVTEDAHWSDPSTLELLERIVIRVRAGRMLTVVVTRPELEAPWLAGLEHIRVEPLTVPDRRQLAAAVVDERRLPEALCELIADRSDGVPLYIEELTRMVARAGAGGEGSLERATQQSPEIPASLHDLLSARLDQFPKEKHIAQIVATIGDGASIALLQRVLGTDEQALRVGLAPLLAGGILRLDEAATGVGCTFRHALVRDAAYQSLLRSRRQELHRRTAEVMEGQFREMTELQPELLAEQLFQGGDRTRAAELWFRSGCRAAGQAAHTEAVAHYQLALSALGTIEAGSAALELGLQIALGGSLLALRGYTSPEAERAYQRAIELSEQVEGQPDVSTRYGLWAYWVVRGDHAVASQLAGQCLSTARRLRRDDDIAFASALLGYQRFYAGAFEEARGLLETAADHRFTEPPAGVPQDMTVAALANLAPTLWILGHPGEARQAVARGLARAEGLTFSTGPFTCAFSHAFASWFFQLAGDSEAARTHARSAVKVSTEYGFTTWVAAGTLHLAIAEAASGSPETALPTLESWLGMWRDGGAQLFVTYFLHRLAETRRSVGDLTGAYEAAHDGLREARARGERFHEAELLRLRGELAFELGRGADASDDLVGAIAVARGQGARAFELRAASSLHRLLGAGTETLRRVVESFPSHAEMPELTDARAALRPA